MSNISQPLVSIIIPCYNAGRWLAAAIESALQQSWERKEVIVVDDGSKDDSLALARSFAARGARILDQPNSGASAARNAGLRAASGEFVQFLDADDLLAPNKIERQLEALRGSEPNTVASGAWGIFREDSREAVFNPQPVWASFKPVDWLLCSWTGGGMMHPAAWLTPRAVVELAGPWNEALSLDDDGEYFSRVLLAASGVLFVPEARSFYRAHAGPRLSASRGKTAARSSFTACELKEYHLLAIEDSPRTRRAIAHRYSNFAWDQITADPELAEVAVARWRKLSPDLGPPPVGRWHGMLRAILGWRAARRLQIWWQTARATFALGSPAGLRV